MFADGALPAKVKQIVAVAVAQCAALAQTGLCRMRTESLVGPSQAPGKRFLDARDRRPRTASEAALLPSRECKPARRPRETAGYSSTLGKSRLASECVVADALALEPVSTPKFPFIRENNREFCESDALSPCCRRQKSRPFQGVRSKFPVKIEPGNFCREPGNLGKVTGTPVAEIGKAGASDQMQSPRHLQP